MSGQPATHASVPAESMAGRWVSKAAMATAIAVFAGAFLLISPAPGTYPGAIPWSPASVLKPIVDAMSLGGAVATVRGAEIKDLAFHIGVCLATALLAIRLVLSRRAATARELKSTSVYAQLFFTAWVAFSFLSTLWSSDSILSTGQATLYAFGVLWAIALAWTLDRDEIAPVLGGLVTISAIGAALCVWYFHERNPFHRPGFPIGNPSLLGAAILPAILMLLCVVLGSLYRWARHRQPPNLYTLIALIALVPLALCFQLTNSRGALVGLVVGIAFIATIFVLNAAQRRRWVLLVAAISLTIVATAFWGWYSSRFEESMARGATIRSRLYTWRYAAELWQQHAIAGNGAGSYPRLAGQFSVRDRALDPAAFMGELIDHAHNELFEIFAEIGLVGGVAWTAAIFATLLAGISLVRRRFNTEFAWLLLGLVASLVALLADAMFGVSLRLPGVPPIFYGLLGLIWAASRHADETWLQRGSIAHALASVTGSPVAPPRRTSLTWILAIACLAAAFWVTTATVRNWSGVRTEFRAQIALERGDFAQAADLSDQSGALLLDPVRIIAADDRRVRAFLGLAMQRGQALLAMRTATRPAGASAPAEARDDAIASAQRAFEAAMSLGMRVPTLLRTDATAARAAELLAELERDADPAASQRWTEEAYQAWLRQRQNTPFDFETLLALTRYASTSDVVVRLMRDALRVTDARRTWRDTFIAVANRAEFAPTFADSLHRMVSAAGPITQETDLDSLVASLAPETHRVAAAWMGLQGDYAGAESAAESAAQLYKPMRVRFPVHYSWALAEQAEYALKASRTNTSRAADLLREAIAALPEIQEQKYEEMVEPYRGQLVLTLLAGGQEQEAIDLLKAAYIDEKHVRALISGTYVNLVEIFRHAPDSPPLREWYQRATEIMPSNGNAWWMRARFEAQSGDAAAVQAILAAAAKAGLEPAGVDWIHQKVCQEFPNVCKPQ